MRICFVFISIRFSLRINIAKSVIYYFSSRSAAPSTIDNLNSSVFTVTPDAKREGGAAEETRTPEKKTKKK